MVTLYLSGPITGVKNYKEAFDRAEKSLLKRGFKVINPSRKGLGDWSQLMLEDLKSLSKCHGIVLLENWESSYGSRIEKLWAEKLEIPVLLG